MVYPMIYKCIDCGHMVEVDKRKAKTFDGQRCPKCDGAFVPSPSA